MVRMNRSTLSHDSVTCRRSPEVSSTTFDAQPAGFTTSGFDGSGLRRHVPLARHRRPHIRFLFIGSHLCSTLLSGLASRRVLFHPCASLSLHVHHVVKRTCTSRLSNMLGTHNKGVPKGTPHPPPNSKELYRSFDSVGSASSLTLSGTALCRVGQSRIPTAGHITPFPAGRNNWRSV